MRVAVGEGVAVGSGGTGVKVGVSVQVGGSVERTTGVAVGTDVGVAAGAQAEKTDTATINNIAFLPFNNRHAKRVKPLSAGERGW